MAIVPQMKLEYYQNQRQAYLDIMNREIKQETPEPKKDHCLDWNDPDVKRMVRQTFKAHRMTMYGGR